MLMNDVNVPVQPLKTLIISMVFAVLLAFFILLAFVGPAEYGIDPTGLGKTLGLTALAKPVQQNTKSVVSCPVGEQLSVWKDIVMISVPAKSGLEYKFYIEQGAEIRIKLQDTVLFVCRNAVQNNHRKLKRSLYLLL